MTCFSAGCVGIMIVGLSIGHSFMICSNFSTLDSIKSKRACPIPFCEFREYQKDPNIVSIRLFRLIAGIEDKFKILN